MKAFLLAAGLGTRLRPVTNNVPKCLVPIGGRPLLQYWIDALARHGISEVLINLHHFPEQVIDFVSQLDSVPSISFFHEPELLGSAGTVRANRAWLDGDDAFLIVYADNLTNANLTKLIDAHRMSGSVATIALFESESPEQCGVVEMDASGVIWRFAEKSPNPPSRLANAGIYVASEALFEFIPPQTPADFGFDVFPSMGGLLTGYRLDAYFLDIGTPERYAQAQADVRHVVF